MYEIVIGTPASCRVAIAPRVSLAGGLNPAKPLMGLRSMSLSCTTWFTYLAPKSALNPLYPPGSCGNKSSTGLVLGLAQIELPCAQCTAMPAKLKNWFGSEASGDGFPKTLFTSNGVLS